MSIPNQANTSRGSEPAPTEVKINLTAIKRCDHHACHIVSTTSHAEVYKFDTPSRTWERTTTEGSLFVYNRTDTPGFGFVVLNRLNSGNVLQYVHPGMEFIIKDNFVMYKSSNDVFCGLHFDDGVECSRVGSILNSISSGNVPIRENNAESEENVVQMLEKAFNQQPGESTLVEQKQKAIELRKEFPRRTSDPTVTGSTRKSGKQQRLNKSPKRDSKDSHSPSRHEGRIKANSDRPATKHNSRIDADNLKRQLFKSPEHTGNKEILSSKNNPLAASTAVLSTSLPPALQMLSLAEVERKLHSSVTTASTTVVNTQPQNVQNSTTSQSLLINPSSFAVPATTSTTIPIPRTKSEGRLVKAASLDTSSQPLLIEGPSFLATTSSHFPPVPPIMVSPGMRSAPVSSSSSQELLNKSASGLSTVFQSPSPYMKQSTTEGKTSSLLEERPLPPSSYQTPIRGKTTETVGQELPLQKAQNGLLSPMVFQDNVTHVNKPMLNKEQFIQAMVYMIQNDKDFSNRLYLAYQQSMSDSSQ
ncbi:mRNA-decapping enzyme 1B-like isoform X2 [Dysidea avara]|uniref:mRNA-decapping enzyme 1B-like isoform X2 n=1 Tax=Dysidea avara TaxID=196820 RepID=UPI00331AF023